MIDKYEDMLSMQYPRPSRRTRMPLSERAKIFLPFSALKGYEERIKDKQRIKEDKRILNNEQKLILNEILVMLQERLIAKEEVLIEIVYYSEDHYETIQGYLQKIDFINKQLKIIDIWIPFQNINEIYCI